jgi:uncharacterized protein
MLEEQVMSEMKEAMKSKNEAALRGLRAIKAEIIKAKTEPGAGGTMNADTEIKILQKMVKQRKDSMEIYQTQNRPDLLQKEAEELAVIERFLPQQLTPEALESALRQLIQELGATGAGDMGKVMGAATKQLAGKADGKAISAAVKALLA